MSSVPPAPDRFTDVGEVVALEPLLHTPSALASSAKQLRLELVPMTWAVHLNHQWHSQLPDPGVLEFGDIRIAHALTFDGGVYAVAVWTRPVAGNRIAHPTNHLVELRRLAIPDYAPKYTATRALGQMERWFKRERPDLCRMLSYQISEVHSGTIYKAANWYEARHQKEHESWTSHSKRKALDQSSSPKVRWERQIRPCSAVAEEPQSAGLDESSLLLVVPGGRPRS
jgi:hypothetical protein